MGVAKKKGRRTKLTPEVQQKIVGAIAAGNYYEVACAIAGISHTTFYNWLEKGRQGKKPYVDFLEAVKKAEAANEAKRLQTITKAAETDWKANAWYLERRYPERWGRKERVYAEMAHSGTVTTNVNVDIVQRIVSDPESRELARRLFRRAVAEDLGGRREE